MDTRWKKCKALCSFIVFFIGVTMLIVNLIPAAGLYLALEGRAFEDKVDYQESGEFRSLISGRLEDLISVATGGKGWVSGYYGSDMMETYDRAFNEVSVTATTAAEVDTIAEEVVIEQAEAGYAYSSQDDQAMLEEELLRHYWEEYLSNASEYGFEPDEAMFEDYYEAYYNGYYGDYDDADGYEYSNAEGWTVDDYMADMAHNKNIRYAVVSQNKLLYTNIDSFEEQTGKEWNGADFSAALDAEDYNFSLWYNRESDGKVQIVKDGQEEDVYGDGIYGEDSRWYMPGYANFTLGESAKDVVVFLAAAREPQLYLVGDYGEYGVNQYGGRLYNIKLTVTVMHKEFQKYCEYLIASVILIILALLMYKSKRLADQRIAGWSGRIFWEIKVFLFLVLLFVLAGNSAMVLSTAFWKIRNGFSSSYYYWGGDITYEVEQLCEAGGYLAAFFWLLYLAVLDWKGNKGKQKKPLLNLLGAKDFKYPIQKRLVRRDRIRVITEIAILLLAGGITSALCLIGGGAGNYLTMVYDYGVWEWADRAAYYGYSGFGQIIFITLVIVLGVFIVFMVIDIISLRKNRRLAEDIGALSDQIQAVRAGNLTGNLNLGEDTDLQEAARNLNEIQKGMETALREQVKSERMKVDLVTNVSHDIKTPLTSIISYVELLRQEQDLPEHVKEFIQILGEKSERLRNIVQDVFEVSKATSGQLPIKMEMLDMGRLLRQTLADMNVQIEQSSFTMKTAIPEMPMPVMADSQRLYRVFQNLLQNALRYSLEGSRIFLTLTEEAGRVVVRLKNTSSVELKDTTDFTERFVRGDESRTDGGSGLGLSIAKSFTQACGGSLLVETDADLFTVTVSFQKAEGVIPDGSLQEGEELS